METDEHSVKNDVGLSEEPLTSGSEPLEVRYDDQLRQLNEPLDILPDPEYARTLRLLHDVFRTPRVTSHAEVSTKSDPLDDSGGFELTSGPDESAATLSIVQQHLPGRFVLRSMLGEGGFGKVYLAADMLLQREVAVKVPHLSDSDNDEVRTRFMRESRAAARLNHPSIVRVLDSGEEHGHAWQVTEYVAGSHLKDFRESSGGTLPFRTAAVIVQQLADAVQHAHNHGVLHRDIKPENIILEKLTPEAFGLSPLSSESSSSLQYLPRLIDFGLARIVDDEITVSRSGLLVGTPKYMSPEQLQGRGAAHGPSSDIYSLGVVLHELLVGYVPFPDATTLPSRILLAGKTVRSLRCSGHNIPPDLETICLKCLSPYAGDRYVSAGELRDDLARFLDGRPTHARPLPIYEQLQRWARRNGALATAIGLASISLLVVLGQAINNNYHSEKRNKELLSALNQLQSEKLRSDALLNLAGQSRTAAEENESKFRTLAWNSSIREALERLIDRRYYAVRQLLNSLRSSQPEKIRQPEWQLVASELRRHYEVLLEAGYPLRELRIVPHSDLLAAAGDSPVVSLIDSKTLQLKSSFRTRINEIHAMAISGDGRLIAVGGCTNADDVAVPSIYSLETGTLLRELPSQPTTIESLLFTSDGKFLICGCRYEAVKIFNLESGAEASLPTTRRNQWLVESLDGSEIIAQEGRRSLIVADPAMPAASRLMTLPSDIKYCLRIPETNMLAVTCYHSTFIDILDQISGKTCMRVRHSGKALTAITCGEAGKRLIVGCDDGSVVSWPIPKVAEETLAGTIPPLSSTIVVEATAVPSSQWLDDQAITSLCTINENLFCTTESGRVVVLRYPEDTESVTKRIEHNPPVSSVSIERESGDIFVGKTNGTISRLFRNKLPDTRHCLNSLSDFEREGRTEVVHSDTFPVDCLSINRKKTDLTWSDWTQRIQSKNLATGIRRELCAVTTPYSGSVDAIRYSNNDRYVAWTGSERRLVVLDMVGRTESSEYFLPGYGNALCFSPDSSLIAVGGSFEGIVLLDSPSLRRPRMLGTDRQCTAMTWSPAGDSLLLGFSNGSLSVCPLNDSEASRLSMPRISIHRTAVQNIVVHKDLNLAASVDETGQVALWNPRTAEVLGVLYEPEPARPYLVNLAPMLEFIESGELMLVYDNGEDGLQVVQWRIDQQASL